MINLNSTIRSLYSRYPFQYRVFFFISAVIMIMTGMLQYFTPSLFQRFIGELDPILCIFLAVIAGLISLSILMSRGWLNIYQKKSFSKFRYTWLFVVIFPFLSILIDRIAVFPADINILFPESLLFYPVIGFFVEILFHVLPLTILLLLLITIFKKINYQKCFWIALIIVALLEPSYQFFFMDTAPTWAKIAVWINLFVFNLIQLYTFKKYDFVRMFALRLVFYFIWHIIWGMVRLEVLF